MSTFLTSPRKPRGDAKLKTLPDDAQAEIYRHLQGHTRAQTAQWLQAERGIAVVANTLGRFWHWYPTAVWVRRGAAAADALDETAGQTMKGGKREAEARRQRAQLVFENNCLADQDLQAYLELRKFDQKTEIERARLALENRRAALRERAAAAEERARKADARPALSPAEKEARIKAVFGIE